MVGYCTTNQIKDGQPENHQPCWFQLFVPQPWLLAPVISPMFDCPLGTFQGRAPPSSLTGKFGLPLMGEWVPGGKVDFMVYPPRSYGKSSFRSVDFDDFFGWFSQLQRHWSGNSQLAMLDSTRTTRTSCLIVWLRFVARLRAHDVEIWIMRVLQINHPEC